jgi:hypothetical protein
MEYSRDLASVPLAPELVCPPCGCLGTPVVTRGTGPHAFRANCKDCGKFLRWVSKHTHEERVHRREKYRLQAMARLEPTIAQLARLKALGHDGPLPINRAVASALIDQIQQGRGR